MGNATGILGLVFGIIACVLSFLIFTALIGLILGVLALILSIIGIATNDSKAPGIVGLIFSLIAIALGIYWVIAIAVWVGRATAY